MPEAASVVAVGEPLSAPDPLIAPRVDQALWARAAVPLQQLHGVALLDRLAGLPRDQIQSYLAASPTTVAEVVENPPTAASVAGWWASEPMVNRVNLVDAAPTLIGNLEGMPYAVRDVANRATLREARADVDARLATRLGRAEREGLLMQQHMLEQISEALVSRDGLQRRLISLDVSDGGCAVISVGDLSSADYVSYLIPGMFFGVDAQIAAWTDTAATLVADQQAWLERLHPDGYSTVAAVAWIGYRTPGLMNVASMELAREGRDALTSSLQGLRAARGDDQPYLAVLAHSYGSTAAMLSLQEDDVTVDALAIVGSPGSPAATIDELKVRGGNVWVGAADWDPIPASGVFGSQPTSPEFGASRFSVAACVDPVTRERLGGSLSHNDYFAAGSCSLRNLALLALGEDQLVVGADRAAGDALKARALFGLRVP